MITTMKFSQKTVVLTTLVSGLALIALFIIVQTQADAYYPSKPVLANSIPASKEHNVTRDFPEAPDFTLLNMEGEAFTLSDHKGEVIVLNIWATWCPPCREEIPDFIEIQNEMKDDGVLFVGVSVDETGWDVVRPFAEEFEINYPLVVDDGTVDARYGPYPGLPTSFIINKQGQVEYVIPGMISKAQLQPILQELAAR